MSGARARSSPSAIRSIMVSLVLARSIRPSANTSAPCVTAFDAYMKPVVDRYLAELEQDLAADGVATPLQIMQSRGGISSLDASRGSVRCGSSCRVPRPASSAAGWSAARPAIDDLITVDIGGTSCDIALISRRPTAHPRGRRDRAAIRCACRWSTSTRSARAAARSPGSTRPASLRVGPHSAGSEPGPACYGRGGEQATVTDASVVLGYIDPDYFAGGTLKLSAGPRAPDGRDDDRPAARSQPSSRRRSASIASSTPRWPKASASSRSASGIDPRGFTLLPLGGGGPLHATALARELGIRASLVPRASRRAVGGRPARRAHRA